MTPTNHFGWQLINMHVDPSAIVQGLYKAARFTKAHSGGGLSISPAERAKRKRREKIAKASRKRNRR